jgi:hypothetical protein
MFALSSENRFHLYSQPTDMRKSFNGLSGFVQNNLDRNACGGDVIKEAFTAYGFRWKIEEYHRHNKLPRGRAIEVLKRNSIFYEKPAVFQTFPPFTPR